LSAAGYRTDASEICQVTGVSCGVLPGALRSGSALVGAPKLGTPQIRGNDVHTFAGCPMDTDTNASLSDAVGIRSARPGKGQLHRATSAPALRPAKSCRPGFL